MMFDDQILNQIFEKNYEKIEENIHEEYHKKIKLITIKNEEERSNIKMNIISELYYKQGFKDGIKFILNSLNK